MPSSITHEMIAREAKDLLPDELQQAVERAPDYYFLGAQGPDLFFFYAPLNKKEYNLGKTLHRGKLYLWFSAMLANLKTRPEKDYDKCLAYALGFCTHLSADVAFHPFVYAYLDKTGAHKRVHQQIENDWDVYFLKKLRDVSAFRYRFPFSPKKIAREGVLFRFVRDCAVSLNRTVKKGAFKRALWMFGWYLKHFHRERLQYLRPVGLKRLYVRKTPDEEILNGALFPELTDGKAQSADELFSFAVRGSAARMCDFCNALEWNASLNETEFSRHLLTGEPTSNLTSF